MIKKNGFDSNKNINNNNNKDAKHIYVSRVQNETGETIKMSQTE
jgi:hypothetical protein